MNGERAQEGQQGGREGDGRMGERGEGVIIMKTTGGERPRGWKIRRKRRR